MSQSSIEIKLSNMELNMLLEPTTKYNIPSTWWAKN